MRIDRSWSRKRGSFLQQEPEIQKEVRKLTKLLRENETIIRYKELEEKIHQNQYLTELREKIKQAQKEAVQFAHYDKPAAEQEAIKRADQFMKEFDQHPLVIAYRNMPQKTNNTPMMEQYLSIKAQYQDAFLFYRLGDFYELFYEDAIKASQLLELTLTSRNRNAEEPIPMCGVPHHAAQGYIDALIEKGYKVAICEQVEDD